MSRKAATQVGSTLSRMLRGRLVKAPPPAFEPLLAHPPPPSLVRALPDRPDHDLPPRARRAPAPAAQQPSLFAVARDKLDRGLRLTAQEDAALADPRSAAQQGALTRRKPPRAPLTRHPRPPAIVFPEDRIRDRFFADHPFEAYRPTSLVEGEHVRTPSGPTGQDWTELRQRSTVPSAEDCISFIANLVEAHGVPLATAYPHGVAQFRTLRAEHDTATRSAHLEAQSFGARFFGEIERSTDVEDRVLDEWANARAIQDALAAATPGAPAAASVATPTQGAAGPWAPAEAAPAFGAAAGDDASTVFTGGVEYLGRFAQARDVRPGAVRTAEGQLVGGAEA
ncbi:hypothetical protein Rhopal_005101-T1 [Rhodotorula paludigena]|uniref:Small ribosomal subunit protein mS23 n=1 Tax=Rhodotorula paludigena TaxID=86838 RepID=A0AAV5GPI4_9BASI|nr:hypothetical protein Rhopal_005101-T1 [Rhodotorula paludigena]